MRIPENKIEEIRDSANIVDVVSEYVRLKKRGKNYVGLCPFHKEKTPSFTVSEEKQIYHCFGCHNGGNVFKFLMEYKKISYIEAVQELAEQLGIKLDYHNNYSQIQSEQEILFEINKEVAQYYSNNLLNEIEAEYARNYFVNRKIKVQTIRAFGLGYALNTKDSLVKFLINKKIDLEKALHLGLIGKSSDDRFYDRLSGRIIFPIFSPNGRVVAFAGRTLVDNPDSAKYINSPESSIYVKGKTLYGLSHAKDEIRKNDRAIIVEGYIDLISLYQNGIKNVVAISGTALTDEQAQLLSRYTKNVVLIFDADAAGINASLRSIEILLKRDFDIKIATLPSNEDPDSFINKFGKEEFKEVIKKAENFLEYQTAYFEKKGAFNDPQETTKAIRELIRLLALIDDELKRDILLKNISKRFNLREKILEKELENALQKIKLDQRTSEKKVSNEQLDSLFQGKPKKNLSDVYLNKEVELIKFLFEGNEAVIKLILNNIDPENLELDIHKDIFYKIRYEYEFSHNIKPSHLLSLFDEETQNYLRQIIIEQYTISENWNETHPPVNIEITTYKYVKDLIIKIKQLQIDAQIKENVKTIDLATNNDLIISLLEKNKQLAIQKMNIKLVEKL
ncbi:MAG: DNA primase [Ignavibacterium sp.]|nr:DNA primase [Ignavibacterium sp.]MDW8375684.1 DNA primase [Ignavibacteriales bacterium]